MFEKSENIVILFLLKKRHENCVLYRSNNPKTKVVRRGTVTFGATDLVESRSGKVPKGTGTLVSGEKRSKGRTTRGERRFIM